MDSTSNAPGMCVQISWNGGTSWTVLEYTHSKYNNGYIPVGCVAHTWGWCLDGD